MWVLGIEYYITERGTRFSGRIQGKANNKDFTQPAQKFR